MRTAVTNTLGGGGHFKINRNLYTGNEKETKKNIKKQEGKRAGKREEKGERQRDAE